MHCTRFTHVCTEQDRHRLAATLVSNPAQAARSMHGVGCRLKLAVVTTSAEYTAWSNELGNVADLKTCVAMLAPQCQSLFLLFVVVMPDSTTRAVRAKSSISCRPATAYLRIC